MTSTPTALRDLTEVALVLRPEDDVAVATQDLSPGAEFAHSGHRLVVRHSVRRGHKLALRPLSAGEQVHKYGQSIGRATRDIAAGDHVHTHNLGMDNADRVHEFGTARVQPAAPAGPPRTFQGYHRSDGRVGTRNYIGILTAVNCSASTARMIALGLDESQSHPPLELARQLIALGPRHAIVKLGALGAVAVADNAEFTQPAVPVNAVDTVGAGDAFVAGYIAEFLASESPEQCLMTAVRTGAFACQVPGDWEGLPRRHELGLLDSKDPVAR